MYNQGAADPGGDHPRAALGPRPGGRLGNKTSKLQNSKQYTPTIEQADTANNQRINYKTWKHTATKPGGRLGRAGRDGRAGRGGGRRRRERRAGVWYDLV